MRIKKVAFCDRVLEWRFEPIYFSNLALLVGVSGVGKTQILKGISRLKEIANGASLNGLAWDITFSTIDDDVEYQWQGEFETKKNPVIIPNQADEASNFRIVREHLSRNGDTIIERNSTEIKFKGNTTPKLSPFQSAVQILNQEEDILPVQQGFNKIIYSDNLSVSFNEVFGMPHRVISIFSTNIFSLDDIKSSNLPILIKIALIARHHPDTFHEIKRKFIDIFPQIEDIKIEAVENDDNPLFPNFPIQIKEKSINDWILQNNISSGMLKTLILISELYLSPQGTVILIDEFENSLGINCIDVVTDLLTENRNIQFILTSHHPYIINNISMEYWKIVTRKGGVVTVTDAKDLNLGKSRHQAFTQLINLEEYSEGIKVE
ncbi:MAG: ATP-binding protein [Microcoleus sp. PH2017_25_DOB_D_A]|uniref:AAA family ATPase n=1 Tax=unclassified Microcoleus TaxID=2642155 RepID=UPI001D582953|nr:MULTISPECIES: AAA family ATPase [unclassified Microcoleus]MCC3465506.1 ATP-binding protein [Microcoleus sp. PH2017_06_SFM_O_A]TAE08041.1 MAG: ATP-binding protein [Oscillatoriales cyanobacterium]MCC3447428.1 ATP-binding protein [Microcoleus sp. PH2017_09_SFU_O_A]MCC3534231.1 ATP-binding protein [Microcoleus sp. PH2017_25_DOB_D_A]MCC3546592.1 ATP-binding protein [Microcoleus sp. PH2017_24_DOB_U_A]